MSYSLLNESDRFVEKLKAFNLHCPRSQEAQDVARNSVLADETRQLKNLLLRFPSHVELSNHVFTSTLGSEIDFELVPFETTTVFNNKTFQMTICRVAWKVCLVEVEQRIVKSVADSKNKGADKLAQRLASMSL